MRAYAIKTQQNYSETSEIVYYNLQRKYRNVTEEHEEHDKERDQEGVSWKGHGGRGGCRGKAL